MNVAYMNELLLFNDAGATSMNNSGDKLLRNLPNEHQDHSVKGPFQRPKSDALDFDEFLCVVFTEVQQYARHGADLVNTGEE